MFVFAFPVFKSALSFHYSPFFASLTMALSSRTTRNSQRHLSTDNEWETLPSIDESLLFKASRELLDSSPSQHAEKHRKDSKSPIDPGAVPKRRPVDDPSLPQATPQVPFTGQDAKQTPPPDRQLAASIPPSLVALQLQEESQELEIKKLELQLQLAKLQGGQIASPTSTESTPGNSLGDLKAPQKTLHPQPLPHIYAPGEPKLYNDLSMPEFCAAYLVIIHQSASKPHYAALLDHFHQLIVFASAYQWSAVRSFHYKVLRSLELGLVKWGDSFDHLKVQFLTPSSSLSKITPRKAAKPPANGEAITAPPKPAIPRHQICDEWSWHNNCLSTDCPKQHVCVVCKRSDHQALACPKRKFPVPARRTESPSQA